MSAETILLQESVKSRYLDWSVRVYGEFSYFQSADNRSIAWPVRERFVEFTWARSGRSGPDRTESVEDYVWRRFNGNGDKKQVRAVASILEVLASQYGRRDG